MKPRALLFAVLALLIPSGTRAQACLGFPTGERRVAVGTRYETWDRGTSLSGTLVWNPRNPVAFGIEYGTRRWDNSEGTSDFQRSWLAVDVDRGPWSICPFVGTSTAPVAGLGTVPLSSGSLTSRGSQRKIPYGLGLARTLRGQDGLILTLFAVPHLYDYKETAESTVWAGYSSWTTEEVLKSGVERAIDLGLFVRYLRFTATSRVAFDGREGSETSFAVGIGILLF